MKATLVFRILTIQIFALLFVSTVHAQFLRHTEIFTPAGLSQNAGSFEMAVVPSTGNGYSGGPAFGNKVAVIDPNTNSVTSIIALVPDGTTIPTVNYSKVNQATSLIYFRQSVSTGETNVVVIDGRSTSPTFNQQLPTLRFFGQIVISFAIDQSRNLLYITTQNSSGAAQGQVQIVDADPASAGFHQTLATVPLPAGVGARGVAVNTITNKIYVGGTLTGGGVFVIDGLTRVISMIASSLPTSAVSVNETLNLIYGGTSNRLHAVDGTNDSLITTITLPGSFSAEHEVMAINSVTGRVYLVVTGIGSTSVIDGNRVSPSFNTILTTIAGTNPINSSGDIAVDESTNKVVVPGFSLRTTIIDGATNNTVTIPTPGVASDVAINPAADRAFIACQIALTQILDLSTSNLVANIPTAGSASQGLANPNNNRYYVGRNIVGKDIQIFDANGTIGTVSGQPHNRGRYFSAALNVSTNRLYMVNQSSNAAGTDLFPANITVVNGATNSVIANVDVGAQPLSIAVNETANKIYIPNFGFGALFPSNISVIDGVTNTASTVNTTAFPPNTFFAGIHANPVANKVYFTTTLGVLGVINSATDVATPVALAGNPIVKTFEGIAVNRALNRVYVVTNTGLRVLNGVNDSEIMTIPVGSNESQIVVNESTARVFLTHPSTNSVSVIDGNSNSVVGTVQLASNPVAIALNTVKNRVYVGTGGNSSVTFIDGASLVVGKTLALPMVPSQLSVNPATSTLYVSAAGNTGRGGVMIVRDVPSTPFDFDGDGRTDVSVFRPASNAWYISNSSNNSFRAEAFGAAGDRIVPADYDGDGKTDVAVWRPASGSWYSLDSSNGAFRATVFGQSGDIPAAGDYDGDGKADVCVFRPSSGFFYLLFSSDGSFHYEQWGTNGDVPLIGDYDADGKTDFAIFRPSSSSFYVLRSSDGAVMGLQWGANADKPITGDFDADGKTDIAVYRPSTGAWYALRSSDNAFIGIAWGTSGDVPVAGDYDGDGKLDVAVFRPPTGSFYILQSTNGSLRGEQFGTSGDLPVPSAFVP